MYFEGQITVFCGEREDPTKFLIDAESEEEAEEKLEIYLRWNWSLSPEQKDEGNPFDYSDLEYGYRYRINGVVENVEEWKEGIIATEHSIGFIEHIRQELEEREL